MSRADRKGWYVKPAGRATVPAVWFAVCVHTRQRGVPGYFHQTEHTMESASAAVVYRKRTGWTHPQTVRVSTGEALREWMREHSLAHRVNWVITPRVDETLALTEWLSYAEIQGVVWGERGPTGEGNPGTGDRMGRVSVERWTVSPTVGIVRYTDAGRTWHWVGAGQFGGAIESGTSVPLRDGGDAVELGRGGAVRLPERQGHSAAGLAAGATALCDWWRANSRAAFGSTVGQLAVGILRSHVPARTLCTHSDPDLHALERAAAFGGRASVWFVGAVGDTPGDRPRYRSRDGGLTERYEHGPLVNLDVRAMYPAIMRDHPLPTKLASRPQHCSPRALDQLIDRMGVIARVTIRTRRAEYPYRSSRGVVFPLGTFTTVLTGPELKTLRSDGDVLEVHECATYHLSSAFSAAADALLSTTTCRPTTADHASPSFQKLLRNSLAGKLAQRAGAWVRDAERDSPKKWGEVWQVNPSTGAKVRRKWVLGLCWRFEEDASGRGPHTAAFAYLTAIGRVQMRRYRDQLPERAVVSQDTDGLWVLSRHIGAFGPIPAKDDAEPGQLSNRGSVDSARFWSPKHYWTSDGWTLAGAHEPREEDWGKTYWASDSPLAWTGKTREAPRSVHSRSRICELVIDAPFGTVMPDGWILPRQLFPRKDGSEREAG